MYDIETVSYVLEGRLKHKDSEDHAGLLNPGDVQWMSKIMQAINNYRNGRMARIHA